MDKRQEEAFWSTITVLDETSALPYVMVIGSWAEYLYSYYFKSDYLPNIRTRDVDFLYPNIRRPAKAIQLERKMVEAGFVIARDSQTEVVKMFKEDLLEIEFLTQQVGAGKTIYMDIPGIGIRGQSLRDVNILAHYPLLLNVKNFNINVPEPAVYALQKIIINPHRVPASKREKDIEAVRNIFPHIPKIRKRPYRIIKNYKCLYYQGKENNRIRLQLLFYNPTMKDDSLYVKNHYQGIQYFLHFEFLITAILSLTIFDFRDQRIAGTRQLTSTSATS